MASVLDWFTGHGKYQTFWHCLGGDAQWAIAIATEDMIIFFGYLIIAYGWWRRSRTQKGEAASSLTSLMWIFIFCGLTYAWTAIDLFWPGWRLMFFAKAVLVVLTWRYILAKQRVEAVYAELAVVDHLRAEVDAKNRLIIELQRTLSELR